MNACFQVDPLLVDNVYFVVLNPPRSEKWLMAATSIVSSSGSAAISSSASGFVLVALTVGQNRYQQ